MKDKGILNINKPQGMTSHDVVDRIRKKTGLKKVGHLGTLDPMVTGVLPICLGSATRISEYLSGDFKTYRCVMALGITTDTQDLWGNVIEEKDFSGITSEQIRAAFKPFTGEIEQTPPMYSAIKVNGKRLYEYAREGKEVQVKSRKVVIRDLTVKKIDLREGKVTFSVECSKGTYVRTICHDVGAALGCGGAMASLERTRSGAFRIERSVTLEKFEAMTEEQIARIILPMDFPLVRMGEIEMESPEAIKFTNGRTVSGEECDMKSESKFGCLYKVYKKDRDSGRLFLGTAFYNARHKKIVPDKVLERSDSGENI